MSKYILSVYSKDEKLLSIFLEFFIKNYQHYFQIRIKTFQIKELKEKISILKSPHVNKRAQEQFRYIYFNVNIKFHTSELKFFFLSLKKVKNQLFPGLKLVIKGINNKSIFNSFKRLSVCNKFFSIFFQNRSVYFKNKSLFKRVICVLKNLDYNGNF